MWTKIIELTIPLLLGLCSTQVVAQAPARAITEIADNLFWAENAGHRAVFLVTSEGVILADPIGADFSAWLEQEIQNRFGVPVRYVLYSHHHWDHASGGSVFADTATFVGHENMLSNLELPPADTLLPPEVSGQDANGNGRLERDEAGGGGLSSNFDLYDANGDGALSGAEVERGPVGDVRPPDLTYEDRMTVTLGGAEAELIHVGRMAHTDDMSVIVFPAQRAAFVVDFISVGRLPFRTMATGQLDAWLNAIRVVEMLDVDIVAPGHGIVGSLEDVSAHRRYIEELRDQVAAGIARGQSLADLQGSVTMTAYQDWLNYDEWRPLNVEGMYRMLAP
jgi:glyoxylase-like metal-dependent hydrolase (beta-lactamase superfamily II)